MEQLSMEEKIDIIIQTVESYGTIQLTLESNENRLCNQLRQTFASITEFENYELTNNRNGTIKFKEYIKSAIYETLSPAYKQIIEEWRSVVLYERERTREEDEILRKKKSIFDNILVRYKKILSKTFGPKCCKCEKQDKWAYTTNCKCVNGGVCLDCLQKGCIFITKTDSYIYNCDTCYNRVMIYKDVYKNVHSLNSLFKYNETPLDADDNDEFLQYPPSRKRGRQVQNQVPVPVPAPVPVPVPVRVPVPVPVPVLTIVLGITLFQIITLRVLTISHSCGESVYQHVTLI